MDKKQELKEILKQLKGEWFEEEENLVTSGYISSFELIRFIHEIEKKYCIKVPLEIIEPEAFNSFDEICELIEKLQGEI